jgi:hypothetical protein
MTDPFREAEATFGRLREKFLDKKISLQEFSDSLKQLRIKDDDGRFWAIGSQSGRWYVHEHGQWVEAKPPSQMERKAICISCGFENDLEAEFCARCGSRPDTETPETASAATGVDGLIDPGGDIVDVAGASPSRAAEIIIRSVDIKSFFWFFGVLGLFAGLVLGLLAGATGLFAGFVARLPGFFVEHSGDLFGAISLSLLGGLFGFVAGGAAGGFLAAVSNGVLSLVGGLRFRRT